MLVWMTIIFIGSSIPGDDIPSEMPPDYLMHFTEYTILGGLIYWWCIEKILVSRASMSILFSSILSSGYGLFDEFHQYFVPGRSPDMADWMADTMGGLCGAAINMVLLSILKRRRSWTEKSYGG